MKPNQILFWLSFPVIKCQINFQGLSILRLPLNKSTNLALVVLKYIQFNLLMTNVTGDSWHLGTGCRLEGKKNISIMLVKHHTVL